MSRLLVIFKDKLNVRQSKVINKMFDFIKEERTEVQMIFDIQLKSKRHNLVYPIMRWRFRKICNQIFDSWHYVLKEKSQNR